MELTEQQLEIIREASREIDFGRITVNFVGSPSNLVEIIPEKHIRFRQEKFRAEPGPGSGGPVPAFFEGGRGRRENSR
jgi:hypothetical protein